MHKSFQSEVTVKAEGTVEAVFSTYDVIDHDGDVTSKGSFTDGAQVIMSAYNHQSWKGAPPWGFGSIHAGESEAVFKGQFLMGTTHGADGFHTVKALSEQGLQEWSYSLGDVVSHKGMLKGAPARFLDSIVVTEVSPVIKGASIDTRTIGMKADADLDGDELLERFALKGLKFSEHTTVVMAQVKSLIERAQEVMSLRAEKGKTLSEDSRQQLMALQADLDLLLKVAPETTSTPDNEALIEYLTWAKRNLQEV